MPSGIVIFLVLFLIIFLYAVKLEIDYKDSSKGSSSDSSFYVSYETNVPEPTRQVDGHSVAGKEDYEKWCVMLGMGDGYERRLKELEEGFLDPSVGNANYLYDEWKMRYQKYRALCISTSRWNYLLGDKAPFQPTSSQLEKEKASLEKIEKKFLASFNERECRMYELYLLELKKRRILYYLNVSPGKKAIRADMFKDLLYGNSSEKKLIDAAYKELLKENIIGEKKDESINRYVVRIIHHRKKKETDLPVSIYQPELYKNISSRTVAKARYSVNSPLSLDCEKHRCIFESITSGERYQTSLDKCTCHAYLPKQPCKHMVKLAMYLGYFNP